MFRNGDVLLVDPRNIEAHVINYFMTIFACPIMAQTSWKIFGLIALAYFHFRMISSILANRLATVVCDFKDCYHLIKEGLLKTIILRIVLLLHLKLLMFWIRGDT